jgi:hypothetical protein
MVVAEALVWLLEDINRWMRAFFWAGKDKEQGAVPSGLEEYM